MRGTRRKSSCMTIQLSSVVELLIEQPHQFRLPLGKRDLADADTDVCRCVFMRGDPIYREGNESR